MFTHCIASPVLLINHYLSEVSSVCMRERFLRDCHPGVKPEHRTLEAQGDHCHLNRPPPESPLAALIQCLHSTLGSNDSHETMDHTTSLYTLLSSTTPTTFHR